MTDNTKPYVRVINISTYIESNRARDNNHSIIKPDGSYVYVLDGIEVPGKQFEGTHPLPTLQKNIDHKGFALDGRTNWID